MATAAFLRHFPYPVLFPADSTLATTSLVFLPGWARADRLRPPVARVIANCNLCVPGNPLHEAKHP